MLTNDDLKKIGAVIEEKLESKLEEKLELKLEEKLELKLEEKLEPIKNDIRLLKNNNKKIRKDINSILKYLDGERASHERRITRVEDHLGLPPME
jgi:hypothetical protein